MKTKTEKLLSHKRKRTGILVPLLEDLLMEPLNVDTEEDAKWLDKLIRAGMKRESRRAQEPVYSPSALSECLRKVYLTRRHSELFVKTKPLSPTAHYYFTTGNWIHVKWQFALYKLSDPDILNGFELLAVEAPVLSKRRDHGGTPDAVCRIHTTTSKNYLVDFKGVNVRDFGKITRGEVPDKYALQLTDYAMLINASRDWTITIDSALLVVESKGGPDNTHPIALHEVEIPIKKYAPEIRQRLQTLREHEKENTIPPPECTKTTSFQFQGCPFQDYCRKEVKAIERRSKSSDTNGLKVATPEARRSNSSRGNKSRRR